MLDRVFSFGLQYVGYALEAGLLVFLIRYGHFKRLRGVSLYVGCLLVIDGLARPYVLYRYGLRSLQYSYFFWLSDVALALGAFLLVCSFFRRACVQHQNLWHYVRVLLSFVFILVLVISSVTLTRHYRHLFTTFIFEFEQNLYFSCLVLNTLLYVLLQQIDAGDDELGLLVCGIGIQFAGPAASLALAHLTPGRHYGQSLYDAIAPMCNAGMLLTWFYAIARAPRAVVRVAEQSGPGLAQATAGRT